jgi:hypothetical protein
VKAPLRRSETKGQGPKAMGVPGTTSCTSSSAARPSAVTWARVPARAAGAVAPAWGAITAQTGAPSRVAARQTSLFSSP